MLKPRSCLSKLATLTCAALLSAPVLAAPTRPVGEELSAKRTATVIQGLVGRTVRTAPVDVKLPDRRADDGKIAVFLDGQLSLVVRKSQVETALLRLARQRQQIESGRNDSIEVCLSSFFSTRGSGHLDQSHEGLDCDQLPL